MSTTESVAQPYRPPLMGTRHMVVAGHHLGAQAGLQILEAGGNAVDAGVAAGICAGVLEPEFVSFAGVAPIMIYLAETREIVTISGLGPWPRKASCQLLQERYGGAIPPGILRTVVPGAPDAWITALERYGTMSFGDVAAAAIRFARDGFPMYGLLSRMIRDHADTYARWPSTAEIFLPAGRPPAVGEVFLQADLARTLQHMADQEATAAGRGREAGLRAARDAFYRGDIAAAILRFHADHGGLLTAADLAAFRVAVEPPVRTRFGGVDVYACGPWCQGPMLLQELNLLAGLDLAGMGHNSPAYVHVLTEAIKLAAADRDAYYGDPRFVAVPMAALLAEDYAAQRRALIRPDRAWPDTPPPGEVAGAPWPQHDPRSAESPNEVPSADRLSAADTSYLCVVDRHGNAFSATPSDGSTDDPVVPGTGLFVSPRGSSAWTDPAHPCAVAPGKRPRLTPNPALAVRQGEFLMPFGTPGGDVQTQAMLQFFLNVRVFGMDLQSAVEAPRFASYSFPSSFEPHPHHPGRLNLEAGIGEEVGRRLADLGHRVEWWPGPVHLAGSVGAIYWNMATGVKTGAADFRRAAYATGW